MEDERQRERANRRAVKKGGIPLWFKLFALVLAGLVIAKLMGLQVVIEISYDGMPFLAALTDARFYFLPLFLILCYILLTWVWKKLSARPDQD